MEMAENKGFAANCPAILAEFETNCGTMRQVVINIAFSKFALDKGRGTADRGRQPSCGIKFSKIKADCQVKQANITL